MLALLGPLASLLGIEVEALRERLQRNVAVWSAVGAFIAIGLIFLLVAANSALTLAFGPVIAPLMIAVGALVIALVIYLVTLITHNAEERRAAERRHSKETAALVTTAALTALPVILQSDLMKKVGIPLGGALAAAFLLARNGQQRER